MFQHSGFWLPDGERHLTSLDLSDYQGAKLRVAMNYVKNWRTAVDIGAHVGLWTKRLNDLFREVHAFEPHFLNAECFRRNLPEHQLLYQTALGSMSRSVKMEMKEGSSADTEVRGEGGTPMMTLDDFDLHDVDFVKIDCVGYEEEVVLGGLKTFDRWKPCVSVEQKPGYPARFGLKQFGAVEALMRLGATVKSEHSGVYVMAWS